MRKILFPIFLFFLFCPASKDEIGSKTTRKKKGGNLAPDFTLKTINNEEFTLSENFGKVIIIDFWDTWCPPCRAEIPHFIELYNEYKDKGFLVIGIAFAREGIEKVISYSKKERINYPVLIHDGNVETKYGGISALPTTFILNKKGEIVEKVVGYREKNFFEERIKSILKE